jgi:hypothetical protein
VAGEAQGFKQRADAVSVLVALARDLGRVLRTRLVAGGAVDYGRVAGVQGLVAVGGLAGALFALRGRGFHF